MLQSIWKKNSIKMSVAHGELLMRIFQIWTKTQTDLKCKRQHNASFEVRKSFTFFNICKLIDTHDGTMSSGNQNPRTSCKKTMLGVSNSRFQSISCASDEYDINTLQIHIWLLQGFNSRKIEIIQFYHGKWKRMLWNWRQSVCLHSERETRNLKYNDDHSTFCGKYFLNCQFFEVWNFSIPVYLFTNENLVNTSDYSHQHS